VAVSRSGEDTQGEGGIALTFFWSAKTVRRDQQRGDCGDESDSEGRMKQSLYILAQQEIVSKMGNVIAFRR